MLKQYWFVSTGSMDETVPKFAIDVSEYHDEFVSGWKAFGFLINTQFSTFISECWIAFRVR